MLYDTPAGGTETCGQSGMRQVHPGQKTEEDSGSSPQWKSGKEGK